MAIIRIYVNQLPAQRPYQIKLGDEGHIRSFGTIRSIVSAVDILLTEGHVLDSLSNIRYQAWARADSEEVSKVT